MPGRDSYAQTAARLEHLKAALAARGSLLVAYSGGVDSTFLLAVARKVLGANVMAVTRRSCLQPRAETQRAAELARGLGARFRFLDADPMALPDFTANAAHRCYICKKALFGELQKIAAQLGGWPIAHGAIVDDLDEFRPGQAAATEAGVLAPLADAGFCKREVRLLSRRMGLATWNQAAASCLATRIPHGTPLSRVQLKAVEQAEAALSTAGFDGSRVRHHGAVARIEVDPQDIPRLLDADLRRELNEALHRIGFQHVALDLEGYVPGGISPPDQNLEPSGFRAQTCRSIKAKN